MRAAALADGRVRVTDVPDPRAKGDVVVVQILVAPLCTEFKDRANGVAHDHPGHEAAGVVVDAGSSTYVAVGDRVVVMPQYACGRCWLCLRGDHIHCPDQRDVLRETGSSHGTGTLAQYVLKPDRLLVPVPDDVSLEHAAMACCGFGPTFTALQRCGVTALDTVLVSGCGPVGLGAVTQASTLGATVLALELNPYRAGLARDLGAAEVIDPTSADAADRVRSRTAGRGASVGIETSGAPTAAALLSASVQRRGRVAVVAWTDRTTFPAMVPSGLDVHACWHWNHQRFTEEMWTMIRRAETSIDRLVTHRFDLDDLAAAMDVQARGDCGKVLVHPFGREAAA